MIDRKAEEMLNDSCQLWVPDWVREQVGGQGRGSERRGHAAESPPRQIPSGIAA